MANLTNKIDTIVLLMFENRSFDHMLGHLSLENINSNVDGLKTPLNKYSNLYNGDKYFAYNIPNDSKLDFDLSHEYDAIAAQLKKGINGKYTMGGFVESYAKFTNKPPNRQTDPMGYFNSAQVPITSFLATEFCTCNRWFSPLPSSTQPNRTMAFTGESSIFKTKLQMISSCNNLFKWMDEAGVRWRLYHDGLSFFVLYPGLWQYVLGSQFRDYEFLYTDMVNEPQNSSPQVIIIEPSYQDAPHIGSDRPNDNHAPLAIGWGEEFLRRTYQAITANSKKWKNTLMVVYYDEHGGFYDHVAPPPFTFKTTANEPFEFKSLGVRIPAIIISPYINKSATTNLLMDHTSVLQFLAERFTPGKPYSGSVQDRKQQGINSISAALTLDKPRIAPVAPTQGIEVKTVLGKSLFTAPDSEMAKSFEAAAMEMLQKKPAETVEKYPELVQWRDAVKNARK